jgi:hypothetical protein
MWKKYQQNQTKKGSSKKPTEMQTQTERKDASQN